MCRPRFRSIAPSPLSRPTLTKDQIAKAEKRRMDCVDCHNRPTHIYVPPEVSVDRSFIAHRLDINLPFLKQQSVAALTGKYDTTDAAMQGIAKTIYEFYNSKYPDLAKSRQPEIRGAIDELQRIYKLTFFPEMKLDWPTHPNNSDLSSTTASIPISPSPGSPRFAVPSMNCSASTN